MSNRIGNVSGSFICFAACIPSGGALLAKVYGLASMQTMVLLVALPCCLLLVGVWLWGRRFGKEELSTALAIGFLGGLLGTFAYDMARLPFHWMGYRVFVPISIFGVWISEAETSSRLTEVIGWGYHFSNGVTFGIMYALFMRRGHWAWAVLWAFGLETIAIFSPFGKIFGLAGNYGVIGIAYWGHIAYGLPLGWLVFRWERTRSWLARMPSNRTGLGIALVAVVLIGWLMLANGIQEDRGVTKNEFRVEGHRLNPDILRISRGGAIRLYNPMSQVVSVVVKQRELAIQVKSGEREPLSFPQTGIYQIFVQTEGRTRSSFVVVEPVEELAEQGEI